MKSPFHYIQFKKNNPWVEYSNKYITDMRSVEPLNDSNRPLLQKYLINHNKEPDQYLSAKVENLLKKEKISDYTGGYYYYVSGLPCDLEGYRVIYEGSDNHHIRSPEKSSKYLNITNGVNMYKVTQF